MTYEQFLKEFKKEAIAIAILALQDKEVYRYIFENPMNENEADAVWLLSNPETLDYVIKYQNENKVKFIKQNSLIT